MWSAAAAAAAAVAAVPTIVCLCGVCAFSARREDCVIVYINVKIT